MKGKNIILPFITLVVFLMTGCATTVTVKTIDRLENSQNVSKLLEIATDKTKSVYIRQRALVSLGNIGNSQSVEVLIDLLDDKTTKQTPTYWTVATHEGAGISIIDPHNPARYMYFAPGTVRYVYSSDIAYELEKEGAVVIRNDSETIYPIRWEAAAALGKIADRKAVGPLIPLLKDKHSGVRATAAEALGKIGDENAVSSLISVLKDGSGPVQGNAIRALVKIGTPAVEPLIAVLKDESDKSDWFRKNAAEALGEIGDPRAIEALKEVAQNDSSSNVREGAKESLKKIQQKQ